MKARLSYRLYFYGNWHPYESHVKSSFLYSVYDADGNACCYFPEGNISVRLARDSKAITVNPQGIHVLLFHSLIKVCTVGIRHGSCGTLHGWAWSLWQIPLPVVATAVATWVLCWTGDYTLSLISVFLNFRGYSHVTTVTNKSCIHE
jgi:hypothetical protein